MESFLRMSLRAVFMGATVAALVVLLTLFISVQQGETRRFIGWMPTIGYVGFIYAFIY